MSEITLISEIDSLDYNWLNERLLVSLKEPELIKRIRSLSERFTVRREDIGEYVLSEEDISAYSYFFLPTNISKLHFLLDQLPSDIRDDLKSKNLIDIGSGPGTYSLGWLSYFKDYDQHLDLFDTSELMLTQAKSLLRDYKNSFFSSSLIKKKNTVAIFGNSINEMGPHKALEYLEFVDADYVIFIEPGTKKSFSQMLRMREGLIKKDYSILYPCLSSEACPLSNKSNQEANQNEENWCHQVLRTTHPLWLERISQLAKLDRKTMPFIGHVYTKNRVSKTSYKATFFRFLNESKYAFHWEICTKNEDGVLVLKEVEIVKKSLDKKTQKYLKKVSVGIQFDFKVLKELNSSKQRIELIDFL